MAQQYPDRYILYRTVASDAQPVGYVINNIQWTGMGEALSLPSGTALASDTAAAYPIGSIYTADSA